MDMEMKLDAYAGQIATAPYWLEGGTSEPSYDYCHQCSEQAAKVHDAERCGGWGSEADSCKHCETCGVLLEYCLTDYGVKAELEHFRYVRFKKPLGKQEAYHVARLIGAAPDNAKARAIAKRAIKAIEQSTRDSLKEAIEAAGVTEDQVTDYMRQFEPKESN